MATPLRETEKGTYVTTHDVPSENHNAETRPETNWKTGWKTQFPWFGVISILCVWISAGAAAIVLVCSNHKAQSSWPKKITPNVILAAINSFSDLMLAIAIGQGVAIAWWRKVVRGATVQDLHYSWGFGTSLWAMIQGWKYLNFIALAALATKVAIIDGILLQRATQTYQANDPTKNITITAPYVTSFPITGVIAKGHNAVTIPEYTFQNTVAQQWNGGSLNPSSSSLFQGCNGVCEGTLPTVGFAYSCDTVTNSLFRYVDVQPLNLTDPKYQNASIPIFDVSFTMSWANATKNYTSIIFDALFYTAAGEDGDCSGNVGHMRCEMRPASLKSDFSVINYDSLTEASGTGSSASLQLGWLLHSKTMGKQSGDSSSVAQALNAWNTKGDQLNTFEVDSFLPIAEDGSPGNSTMGGIQLVLQEYMGASANISYNATSKLWDLQSEGTFANTMLGFGQGYVPDTCNYMYAQGTGLKIIYAINNLAMSISTSQAYSQSDPFHLQVQQTKLGVHYKTAYAYMAAAIASMILCTFLVIPTYWGYWELGRPVSLAPVEIASAFMAPVLDHPAAGKGVVDDLLVEVGHRKIMFGHLDEENRLGVQDITQVRRVGSGP